MQNIWQRLRLKPFLVLVAGLLILTGAAHAVDTPPSGKWWRVPAVTRELGLTDRQIDDLEDSFHRHRRKLIRLKKDVESEQFELEILVDTRVLDVDKAMAQHRRLEEARGALATERFAYFLDIRQILGIEKFRRLIELKKKFDRRKVHKRQ